MKYTVTLKDGSIYKDNADKIRIVINKDKQPRLITIEYYRGESCISESSLDIIDYIDICS